MRFIISLIIGFIISTSLNLNSKDCTFETRIISGIKKTKSGVIMLFDKEQKLGLLISKENTKISVSALSNDLNLSNSNMIVKIDDDTNFIIKFTEVDDSDSKTFFSIVNNSTVQKDGYKFAFATKKISEISFYDTKRKEVIFSSVLDSNKTEEVSKAFNCIFKIEEEN